jgi:hypothetical protein
MRVNKSQLRTHEEHIRVRKKQLCTSTDITGHIQDNYEDRQSLFGQWTTPRMFPDRHYQVVLNKGHLCSTAELTEKGRMIRPFVFKETFVVKLRAPTELLGVGTRHWNLGPCRIYATLDNPREVIPEIRYKEKNKEIRQIRVTIQSRKNTSLRLSAVHLYADEWGGSVLNTSSICQIRLWICLGAAPVWQITTTFMFHTRVTDDADDDNNYYIRKDLFY